MELPNGWLTANVPDRCLDIAIDMRAIRDRQYRNIFEELPSDCRYVGEIGELMFHAWLRHVLEYPYEWITEEAAGKPDYILASQIAVELKTVKRGGPMFPHYAAGMTARHVDKPADHYFFACYEKPLQKLWLIGGITKSEFKKHARYYGAGEVVHPGYTIRAGHEIYNIEIERLTKPKLWIDQINDRLKYLKG